MKLILFSCNVYLLLQFNSIFISTHWFLIFFFFNLSYLTNYTSASNMLNLLQKVFFNDFFFNNFYFLWISLWNIPIYIYLVFLFLLFNTRFINPKKTTTLAFLKLIILIIYLNYLNFNFCVHPLSLLPEDVNTLLTNSVNKLHPLLLYISGIMFIKLVFNLHNFYMNKIHKNSFIIFTNSLHTKIYLIISIFTLYLGSWWAFQEGSWGGWWNWDFSEVFGLFILLKFLFYIHQNFYIRSYYVYQFYLIFSFLSLLLFYLSIQLNFSYVSHNFGFRFYKFLNTSIFLNIFMFMFILIFINALLKYKDIIIMIAFFHNFSFLKVNTTLSYSIKIILYLSLLVIINDFFWNNFNLNIFNYQLKFNVYTFYISIFLLINLYKFNYKLFFSTILGIFFSYYNTLLFFVNISSNNITLLIHYIILFLFFYSLLKHDDILSNFYVIPLGYSIKLNFYLMVNVLNIEICSNSLEDSTAFVGKYFSLIVDHKFLSQNFYPLGYSDIFNIKILDNTSFFIYLYFFYLYLYFVSHLDSKRVFS